MKRLFLYIIIGVGLAACGDVESSDNGDLDGFWLLCSVDTLGTGRTGDVRDKGLTWAFEGKLLEVRDVWKVHQDIILSFSHSTMSVSCSRKRNRHLRDSRISMYSCS